MALPLRPNVLRMVPYSPGKPISEVQRELGLERVVKLASNENPYGPSPMAIDAVRQAAAEMHIYPDASGYELVEAICRKFGVNESQVLLGNGSDELIHLLGLVFLSEPADQVIVGEPSFVRYAAASELAATQLVKVPVLGDFGYDLDGILKSITKHTKLIFLANPNNPTGRIIQKPEFERFLDGVPEDVPVVLDEAYYEFARDAPNYPNSVPYVLRRPNVVGLRTFSKAYGLAGIRVGYGFAPEAIVDAVNRAREPFNVNSLAQVAATAALEDDAHVQRTVSGNRSGMEVVVAALRGVGAKPVPSSANFVLADFGRPAHPIFEALLRRGVIVRSGVGLGLPNCLRVSIGTPEENQVFAEALPPSV